VISHSKKVECTCDSPVIWVKGIAFRSIKTDPTDVSPSDMRIDGDRVAKCSLEELNFAVEGDEKLAGAVAVLGSKVTLNDNAYASLINPTSANRRWIKKNIVRPTLPQRLFRSPDV